MTRKKVDTRHCEPNGCLGLIHAMTTSSGVKLLAVEQIRWKCLCTKTQHGHRWALGNTRKGEFKVINRTTKKRKKKDKEKTKRKDIYYVLFLN